MAYTLATVNTRVQRKLDNTSFNTAKLMDFANDAQREIFNRYRLGFNEREDATVTTTSGSTALTGLPTDMSIPINLRIFSPTGNAMLLPYVEYEEVDLMYPNVSLVGNSPPVAWTIFNGTPRIINNADATYTLYLKYVKTPIELTATSDVPEIPVDFSELLVLGMYARALEHDDEFDKAAVIRQQMDALALDINDRYRRQAGVPHVMRSPLNLRRALGRR